MKTVLIGALMIAALGGAAGAYYRPEIGRDVPGPSLVVSERPAQASGDRFWADYQGTADPYGG